MGWGPQSFLAPPLSLRNSLMTTIVKAEWKNFFTFQVREWELRGRTHRCSICVVVVAEQVEHGRCSFTNKMDLDSSSDRNEQMEVVVINVTRKNLKTLFPAMMFAVQNSDYIAIDLVSWQWQTRAFNSISQYLIFISAFDNGSSTIPQSSTYFQISQFLGLIIIFIAGTEWIRRPEKPYCKVSKFYWHISSMPCGDLI